MEKNNNLPTLYKESIFSKIRNAILRFFKKEPEIQLDIKPNNTVKIEDIVQPKNISKINEKTTIKKIEEEGVESEKEDGEKGTK